MFLAIEVVRSTFLMADILDICVTMGRENNPHIQSEGCASRLICGSMCAVFELDYVVELSMRHLYLYLASLPVMLPTFEPDRRAVGEGSSMQCSGNLHLA